MEGLDEEFLFHLNRGGELLAVAIRAGEPSEVRALSGADARDEERHRLRWLLLPGRRLRRNEVRTEQG